MRGRVIALALSLSSSGRAAAQAGDLRQAMLVAEDARDTTAAALAPLVRGLGSRDLATVLRAVRGLGRFERPGLAHRLLPLLPDPRGVVRAELAHALTQAAQGLGSAGEDSLWARIRRGIQMLARDLDPAVRAGAFRSLGRLPYRSPAEIREARTLLLAQAEPAAPAAVLLASARALEALIRLRSQIDPPDSLTLSRLRGLASYERGASGPTSPVAARVRRLALAGLLAAASADSAVLASALGDVDAQVRRLAALTLAQAGAGLPAGRELLTRALRDSSAMVRLEALRGWGARFARDDCRPLLDFARDPSPHVALAAIDLLGAPCGSAAAASALLVALADTLLDAHRVDRSAVAAWHRGAHALVALGRLAPDLVRRFLSRAGAHEAWQVRMYAARAAAEAGDMGWLLALARDAEPNVREAAVAGLLKARGHHADSVFLPRWPAPTTNRSSPLPARWRAHPSGRGPAPPCSWRWRGSPPSDGRPLATPGSRCWSA